MQEVYMKKKKGKLNVNPKVSLKKSTAATHITVELLGSSLTPRKCDKSDEENTIPASFDAGKGMNSKSGGFYKNYTMPNS